ncbi:MAG: nucleotidyltransferase family protein [Lachnospiraceae bacterium]|nr:nucleotidyltransferase family protein [Lachnospiraceae bacterium]
MKTAGIICEYNPFHNGHKKQLAYAHEVLGCDAVICAMSGDFVQRGQPAILDKYSRAASALRNGADLVLELPVSSVLSSAEGFAFGGVRLLAAAGADALVFGARYPDPDLYRMVADILREEPPRFQASLRKHISEGYSFPHARALALQEELSGKIDHLKDFLLSPNDMLGIEYRKALDLIHSTMDFCPMKRVGADYYEEGIQRDTASASYIRGLFSNQMQLSGVLKQLSNVLPEDSLKCLENGRTKHTLLYPDDLSSLLNYQLLMKKNLNKDFINPASIGSVKTKNADDFYNRLQKNRFNFRTFNERADLLKSKNITRTHICRLFCRTILELGPEIHDEKPRYLRVLGFTEKGRELLPQIREGSSLPIVVNPGSDRKKLSESAKRQLDKDLRASELCRMLREEKSGLHFPSESQRRFSPIPE